METTAPYLPEAAPKPKRSKKATRPQLLMRDQLDGRTNAAKVFDRIVVDIENDLGGHDQLSTITRALIEGFAGAALTLYNMNTQLALGEPIDPTEHAQAVSVMVRVASRLGVQRRARDVTSLSLDAYMADARDLTVTVGAFADADAATTPKTKTRISKRRRGRTAARPVGPASDADDDHEGDLEENPA